MRKSLASAGLLALLSSGGAFAQECTDPVQITWSTIAGFYTDAMASFVKSFEDANCAKVTVVNIDNSQLYNKQVIEMVGQTGAYDVVTLETAEKAEFAENGFIRPMTAFFADKQDLLNDVSPTLRAMTVEYKGDVWGLPYYTYSAGMFVRQDLLDDPTEKEAFKAKYGYELAAPTTWEQHRDIAEFFTRKQGDMLKGQPLDKDFYGVGLMAGPFPEIQDEMSAMIWGMGSDWLNAEGKVPVDDVEKAMDMYLRLMPFAPPAALTVTYDGVMNQMKDCQIAMTAGFFLDQWPNAVKTEENCPGATMAAIEAPLKKAYVGGFLLAVSSSSANPEMAEKFVAHIGGPEIQQQFAEMGGASTLTSVLTNPMFATPEKRATNGQYATLNQVFESMAGFSSNLFKTPFGAKIYNTMQIPLQSAASGQISAREAAEQLAADVEKICGGPCPIAN
ncbi:MAG: extracellular solute-binding protein [Rhodobacter sp.]|nr:extracellular solute-binding protein [Rhodobacter sp.]MCA3457065.1 extracellular solute-binding protein [Rhodobacter sp.]MCA3461482.1 extracellular solute-binding protein [Rhodobacter sp.]MCA3464387.1 extracellular solute-binding protein [Rhodobacter sp.]MCA3466564.1 extracellular solute-binding protein [Rhodobacter sp.]